MSQFIEKETSLYMEFRHCVINGFLFYEEVTDHLKSIYVQFASGTGFKRSLHVVSTVSQNKRNTI